MEKTTEKITKKVIIAIIVTFLTESIYPIFSERLKYYANKIYESKDLCSLLIQIILCIGICVIGTMFIKFIKFMIIEYNDYKSYKEITSLH